MLINAFTQPHNALWKVSEQLRFAAHLDQVPKGRRRWYKGKRTGDVMALATTELCKEFAFGAAAGLAAGYLSKKAGSAAVAAAGAVSFVCLRAAIFDGHHLATWSPLEACSFRFISLSAHSRTVH